MRLLICFFVLVSAGFAELGLTVAGKDAQLQQAKVQVQLHGRFLIRDLKLVFHNEGRRVAEGDLRCPLDRGEEIVSFAMDVNGMRRDGVVVPQKQARHAYETIVSRGVDPGLLEVDEVANEFRTRVFPIPSNGTKTVWIRTVQVVGPGKVQLWPRGLGRPMNWELSVATAGGEGSAFPERQSGGSEDVPERVVSWKPTPGLAYRSDYGDLRFAQKKVEREPAHSIEIWLDGTVELGKAAIQRLEELLVHLGSSKVVLKVFREEVGEGREYTLMEGKSPGLLAAIGGTKKLGMARPRELPWHSVVADAVVLITDGAFATGRAGLQKPACPLHVIDSGKGTSQWLRTRALVSGGGWHGSRHLDPDSGMVMQEAELVGEVFGETIFLKAERLGLETPIANWVWGRLKSQEMSARGNRREVIDAFHAKHGVMDSASSLIVMETARQYQEFEIEPPKADEALYRGWEILQEKERQRKEVDLKKLAGLWKERCDRLAKPVPNLGMRLIEQAEERSGELGRLFVINPKSDLGMIAPLLIELKAIHSLAIGGIQDEEIGRVKDHLANTQKLETELEDWAPWVELTVGGQVRKPGRYSLPMGSTLSEAIEIAGGATPYAALNRVKLYREGKVRSYDLRNASHPRVRVYPRDVIEVPEAAIFGNGGSPGKTQAPFAKVAPPQIAFQKGDSHPPKYYLTDLAKRFDDEEKWWKRYRLFRGACGWRAGFYRDVISFLDDREETAKALRVAGDLAEHMPDHPEVLRKAAMAYRRLGESALSGELFERIEAMQPGSAIALFDLARSEQARGKDREALELYWKAVQIFDSQYTVGRCLIVLEEMNALLARSKLKASEFGIDPRLVRHVPVDFRVVMEWDAYQSNLDLVIRKPMGQAVLRYAPSGESNHEWWSGNLSEGFGPESWSVQGLLPGTHEIVARFYGDWNEEEITTVTAEVEVTRNFGMANETREIHALRVQEKTEGVVLKAKVYPEGWE